MSSPQFEILLAEDNPADVRLMTELFRCRDGKCRLTPVADGEEALAYLLRKGQYVNRPAPDLILLDLNIPKVDGKEVLRAIRNHPRFRTVPVIVLTTSQNEDDINECYALGANCYLNKPHDLDELDALLDLIERFWVQTARLPTRPD